jgi:hypothetical protein
MSHYRGNKKKYRKSKKSNKRNVTLKDKVVAVLAFVGLFIALLLLMKFVL